MFQEKSAKKPLPACFGLSTQITENAS